MNDSRHTEKIETCSSYAEAVERFLFYVHLTLEDGLNLLCVNILNGKKCIKMFSSNIYGYGRQ